MTLTTLQKFFTRADELRAHQTELETQRAELARARSEVIERASGSDDRTALAKLREIRDSDELHRLDCEKTARELARIGPSMIAEAQHVRAEALAWAVAARGKETTALEKALTAFYPDGSELQALLGRLRPRPPRTRNLELLIGGLESAGAQNDSPEAAARFAQTVLGLCNGLIELGMTAK